LLTQRGILVAFGVLALDIALSMVLLWRIQGFFAGIPLLLGAVGAIGLFVLAAWLAPKNLLLPRWPMPTARPATYFAVAVVYFLLSVAASLFPKALGLPPIVAIVLMLAVGGVGLAWVLRHVGRTSNESRLVAFVAGLYLPIMVAGTLGQLPYALVFAGDVAFSLFLIALWRVYSRTRPETLSHPRSHAPP
jgi:hypothetical protein